MVQVLRFVWSLEDTLLGQSGAQEFDLDFTDPRLLLLAGTMSGMFIFVLRQMVLYQKHFTKFYIEENTKLRGRVDELEKEVEHLNVANLSLTRENMSLRGELSEVSRELRRVKEEFDEYIRRHP